MEEYLESDVCWCITNPNTTPLVLSVCTDRSAGLINLMVSLRRLGYQHKILGLGEKWQGWKWRTSVYLKALENMEERIVCLVDGTDVLFLSPPDQLVEGFRRFNKPIVVGAERGCCTGHLKYSLIAREEIMKRYAQRTPSPYRYPNAGVIVGYTSAVRRLLTLNQEAEDDQVGLLQLYDANNALFKLDTTTSLIGTLAQSLPMFHDELEINEKENWEVGRTPLSVRNRLTGGRPAVVHFAGGNFEMYNDIGRTLLGPIHQEVEPNPDHTIKYAVKKPWAATFSWLFGV